MEHHHGWVPEYLQFGSRRVRPQAKLLILSIVVGVVAGLGAIVFYCASEYMFHYTLEKWAGYSPTPPGGEVSFFPKVSETLVPWLLVLIPTVGGLFCGLIVYTFAPEAEGHGTDTAIDAYHRKGGEIPVRVPIIKIFASAITLGTGGSGGREGPIALIGAGFGSLMGRVFKLNHTDLRILMAAGMGAGIAAIFRAPLAGAMFAAEVLYRSPDIESEVIIPSGLASVTAYCTFASIYSAMLGFVNPDLALRAWDPLFKLPEFTSHMIFHRPIMLLSYTLLGAFMVLLAMVYVRLFYGMTNLFKRLPGPPHLKPMIGGLWTGVIAVGLYFLIGRNIQVLSILGFGYGVLQDAFNLDSEHFNFAFVLLAVALGKLFATSLTIGSGGSAGVFGPSMVIGGCAGGALWIFLRGVWPEAVPHHTSFIIVGMAGFFAAAAKTPFSTLIMVCEITQTYSLLVPALWVCVLCFLFSDENSIYSKQSEGRAYSPAHQGDLFRMMTQKAFVFQIVKPLADLPFIQADDPIKRIDLEHEHAALPVTDPDHQLKGMVYMEAVRQALRSGQKKLRVREVMRKDVPTLSPEQSLEEAVKLFAGHDVLAVPAVDSAGRVLGMVRSADVFGLYWGTMSREHGEAPQR